MFEKCRQRLELTPCDQLFGNCFDYAGQARELSFKDGGAVSLYSFGDRDQMRRGEEPGANAGGAADRVEKSGS